MHKFVGLLNCSMSESWINFNFQFHLQVFTKFLTKKLREYPGAEYYRF